MVPEVPPAPTPGFLDFTGYQEVEASSHRDEKLAGELWYPHSMSHLPVGSQTQAVLGGDKGTESETRGELTPLCWWP